MLFPVCVERVRDKEPLNSATDHYFPFLYRPSRVHKCLLERWREEDSPSSDRDQHNVALRSKRSAF